jgi:outer membrane autotransporter protein
MEKTSGGCGVRVRVSRACAIICALSLGFALTSTISYAQNLVQNPGFETGAYAPAWSTTGQTDIEPAGAFGIPVYGGNYYANPFGTGGTISQSITVSTAGTYQFAFYYAVRNGQTWSLTTDVAGNPVFTNPAILGTSSYLAFTDSFSLSPGTNIISFDATCISASGGCVPGNAEFAIDDVSLYSGVVPNIDRAQSSYAASTLGVEVNPVFQGGTLLMDQIGTTYSENFTLDNSGTNTIDQDGHASTLSGVFSDAVTGTPGSIIIANSGSGGSVTFTGTNTYTGTTTINSGATLALGGTGSIATSAGVVDNGTFTISGTSLGASVTTLSGSGSVTLGAQTLSLINAANTFSGIIGGAGGLTLGAGTEVLDGINTYTGPTTIAAGTLQIGDAATTTAAITSSVTINSGAMLAGYGTVTGAVTNIAGGTLFPGGTSGTIGTLRISGGYTQGAGSTMMVEVNPTTASKLAVIGTAALAGTLHIVYDPGTYGAMTYPIVTATGGVSGTFGSLNGTVPSSNLTQSVTYSANAADLVLGAAAAPTTVATNSAILATPQTVAISDFFSADWQVFNHLGDLESGENADQVRTALAAAKPLQLALNGSQVAQLDDATAQQLSPTALKSGAWVRSIGNFLTVHGAGGEPGFDAQAGGLLAGIDRPVGERALIGVAAGYSRTFLNQNDGTGGTMDTPRAIFYASYKPAATINVDTLVGVAYDRIDTNRPVPALGTAAVEGHNGYEENVAFQAGYTLAAGDWTLVPRVGAQYVHFAQTAYTESGASGFDLSSPSIHTDSFQPVLSATALDPFTTAGGMRVMPEFKIAYSRELLSTNQRLALTTPSGGVSPATVIGGGRNMLTLGPGITAQLIGAMEIYADYRLSLGLGKSVDNTISAGGRWIF